MSQSLLITGGATESIFPLVEAVLLNLTDYQIAINFMADSKEVRHYRSLIDFLFCEINPSWKTACFQFYLGSGKQLKDLLKPRQIKLYQFQLLKALELALLFYEKQLSKSWLEYIEVLTSAIAHTA